MQSEEDDGADETPDNDAAAAERGKGLPAEWGAGRGSERFSLPAGWRDVMARYRGMGPSKPLDEIFITTVGHEGPTEAIREREYIDEDYRDEYANFYAKTYRPLPSRCERLHFFVDPEPAEGETDLATEDIVHRHEGQRYLGFVILRPIIGRPVSRTILAPPSWIDPHVSCKATASATLHGFPLTVRGFPFISQDSQFGSCSHAAMWMISLYFHLRYRRPRHHISDLAASARVHQDLPPSVPSAGLTPRQISAVLHDLDMQPVIYRLDRRLPERETAESIACRYLNSGLPVMLLSGGGDGAGHAQVLIGYGRKDGRLFFVHHDDQIGPYLVTRHLAGAISERQGDETQSAGDAAPAPSGGEAPALGERTWHALIVPLPGRIYLSGETAENTGRLIVDEEIQRNVDAADHGIPEIAALAGGLQDGRLRLRSYLTEVSDYKRRLRERNLPDDVLRWHLNISTSHWLWVVELQDSRVAQASHDCVLGEIVIDATSDDQWVNPMFGNLPGLLMWWPDLGDDTKMDVYDDDGTPYRTGCALHVPS